MEKQDVLFRTDDSVFSYRVAGILIHDGKVLLQHPTNDPDPGLAFPGGHVNLGEVSEAALLREFKEEIAVDIRIERLLWIAENFFPWGERDCHQVGLYYLVSLRDETQIPLEGSFFAQDEFERQCCELEFRWVELAHLDDIVIYPTNIKEKLANVPEHIERFVYIEKS